MENSIGNVRQVTIEDEMRGSYLEYAMSVIIQRALPDVRDGLKPVHRRILHSMNEEGVRPGTPPKKCARVVGSVMGKYHPDGDPPAAMRYTECRLAPVAMELLRDINEETVDFIPNYDGLELQPEVLPA